jgi:uncharacterized protein YegL
MTGRIIGIRTVRTPGGDGVRMVFGGTKSIAQAATETRCESGKGVAYLLVDCSGSMGGPKISQAKKGVLEFAQEAMGREYDVGIIKFSSAATHLCGPGDTMEDVTACLDKMDAGGSTNMAEAIAMAHQRLGDSGCKRVMVIATDGRPDRTRLALRAGQTAKDDGIEIITIGTDDADLAFLQRLATSEECGRKVSSDQFGKAIGSAFLQLPDPSRPAWNYLGSRAADRKYVTTRDEVPW